MQADCLTRISHGHNASSSLHNSTYDIATDMSLSHLDTINLGGKVLLLVILSYCPIVLLSMPSDALYHSSVSV